MKNIVRIMLLAAVGLIIFSCRSVNHIQNSWLIPAPHANFNGLYIVSDLVGISYSDDVWIIEKSGVEAAKKDTKAYRASLIIEVPGENKQKEFVPLPLSQTIVKGKVDGYVAKVFVTQKYKNPYDTKIEASYIFPLPQNSAVTDFIMIIGKRRIRGIIREKEEAKRIYKEARRQGYRAALMTQERPNIFTQKVANIEPQKEIDIQITYFNTLKFEEGEYEFVFPMVVGPRFNPPGSKDPIKVGTWGKGAKSIDEVMVKYLAPNQRSGHTIKLSLDIDAGVEIENVRSSSHVIDIARNANNPQKVSLALKPIDRIPNRDFILRYTVSGKKLKSALLIDKNSNDEKIFSLMLLPPKEMKYLKRQPREMIFVVDCSGSMRGKPLDKAKDAMRRCLKGLNGDDSFQIIRFSESAFSLGKVPIQATPANIRRGLKFVKRMRSGGGTMMIKGIERALQMPHDDEKLKIISFMTDGYIGNEMEILKCIHKNRQQARVFSFGVGSSVNRYLIENMARVGRGAAAFVGLNSDAGEAVDQFYERAAKPALMDIKVDFGTVQVTDVYPKLMPDLFVGRPVIITGKFHGELPRRIKVSGRTGGKKVEFWIPVAQNKDALKHEGIRYVWARKKIADMNFAYANDASQAQLSKLVDFSIDNSVLCKYTAFLGVDSSYRTKGDRGVSVNVGVPVPDGVSYDTTVK